MNTYFELKPGQRIEYTSAEGKKFRGTFIKYAGNIMGTPQCPVYLSGKGDVINTIVSKTRVSPV